MPKRSTERDGKLMTVNWTTECSLNQGFLGKHHDKQFFAYFLPPGLSKAYEHSGYFSSPSWLTDKLTDVS